MTELEALKRVVALVPAEEIELIDKLSAMIAAKEKISKKQYLNANQKENLILRDKILEFMEPGRQYSVKEINAEFPELKPQKVSAVLTQMYVNGYLAKDDSTPAKYWKPAR